MRAFNIKVDNTQSQIKSVHNLYKDGLHDILDSYIDNIITKIIYTKSRQIK